MRSCAGAGIMETTRFPYLQVSLSYGFYVQVKRRRDCEKSSVTDSDGFVPSSLSSPAGRLGFLFAARFRWAPQK